MAQRRSLMTGLPEDNPDDGTFAGDIGAPNEAPINGPIDPGGNTDKPRDLQPPGSTPTEPITRQTPPVDQAPPDLPQGVIVPPQPDPFMGSPDMFAGESGGGNSYEAPAQEMFPSPVSERRLPPAISPMESAGPQRRTMSSAPSQIFDQGNNAGPGLFGANSQGLIGGGLGVPGSGDNGPSATAMMLALKRALMGEG